MRRVALLVWFAFACALLFPQAYAARAVNSVTGTTFSPSSLPGLEVDYQQGAIANASGVVPTWTDTGPNLANLTSSGTQRPTYVANAVNGAHGAQATTSPASYMGTASLTVPATKYATMFLVAKLPLVTSIQLPAWELPASAYTNNGIGLELSGQSGASWTTLVPVFNNSSVLAQAADAGVTHVYAVQYDGTGTGLYGAAVYVDKHRVGWVPAVATTGNFASGPLSMFSRSGSSVVAMTASQFDLYSPSSPHTAAQVYTASDQLQSQFGLAVASNVEDYIDGDSISSTYGTVTRGWVGHAAFDGSFPANTFTSSAYSGKTFATGYGTGGANVTAQVAAMHGGTAHKDAILWLGTNDLAGCANNSGVAALVSNVLLPYVAYLKAHGFRNVAVTTMLPRTGTSETCREGTGAWNPAIRNNAASAGYVVNDVGADANIGQAGQYSNATYYQDGIHLNDFGQSYVTTNYFAPLLAGWGP